MSMQRTLCVIIVWLVTELTGGMARSQSPTTNSSTTPPRAAPRIPSIAVIDLVKVFDQHPFFRANLEATQQQAHEFELQLSTRKAKISQLGQHLNELNTNSAEYRSLETGLARQLANLRVWTRQRQTQLMRQKAEHYYATYQDIIAAIARVAQRRRIALVLRVTVETPSSNDIPSLVRQMNQPVILQEKLDITQQVIDELRTTTASQGPPATTTPIARVMR